MWLRFTSGSGPCRWSILPLWLWTYRLGRHTLRGTSWLCTLLTRVWPDTNPKYIYSVCYMQVRYYSNSSRRVPSSQYLAKLHHFLPLPGEWITGSVCMYIARYLAAPDTSNLMVRECEQQISHYYTPHQSVSSCFLSSCTLQLVDLLKRVEFIIVPVANPDGYYVSSIE